MAKRSKDKCWAHVSDEDAKRMCPMIDEINRLILEKRYDRHIRGKAMSILMAMDGANRKPYTHRSLKNKPVPMPDQGLEWKPLLSKPLIDLNPPAYRMTVYE